MKKKADWEIAIEKTNAAIAESERKLSESMRELAETDKEVKKEMAEINKEIRHIISDLSKEIKGVNSKVNGIGDSNGIRAETFFEMATENGITLKINDEKTFFEQTAINLVVNDEKLTNKAEIDIVMTNCDYLLLIETKYRLDEKNEGVFDKKINALKKYEPQAVKGKKILTAFATLAAKNEIKNYFTSNGHFVFTENNRKIQTDYPVL